MERNDMHTKLMAAVYSPNEHPTVELGNTTLDDAVLFVHGEYYHHRIDKNTPLFEYGEEFVETATNSNDMDTIVSSMVAYAHCMLVLCMLDDTTPQWTLSLTTKQE